MFKDNLVYLRKIKKLSQEELGFQLGVSRQTVSNWETGEALPDIEKCKNMAEIFGVALDDLVNYEPSDDILPIPPKGKHAFGVVTVGDKGQIVIPVRARKIFDIRAGDQLFVLGDEGTGIALIKEKDLINMITRLRKGDAEYN